MMNLSNFSNLFPFRSNMPLSHSPVNTLLEEPDVSLDRLLDQESIVNDFKIQNPKLMQFMKYDKYKTLLEYVTVVGPEGEQKRSYKYPFVSCELLTTENNSPAEFMLPEKELFVEEEEIEEVEVEEEIEDTSDVSPAASTGVVLIEKIEPSDLPKLEQPEATTKEGESTATAQIKIEGDTPNEKTKEEEKPATQAKPKEGEGASEETPKEEAVVEKKPKMIKRMVKKKVIKKTKRQVPALIGDLFKYIEGEMNYTLAGYFSRVLNALFTKKSTSLTNFFFGDVKNRKILDHAESRSIADIIIKFLTIDSMSFLTERQEIVDDILQRLSKPTNTNMMCNLSAILCEIIEKYSSTVKSVQGSKEMLQHIYGIKFCETLINNIISDDEQVSIYNTPIMLCSLTSIRNLLDSKEQSKNTDLIDKYQEIMSFLKNNLAASSELTDLFKNFFIKAVDKLNLTKRNSTTLGMGKVRLVESLFFLIKFDLFNIQSVVTNTPFFQRLFQLVKEYELNNVLHNEIVKIVHFILELEEPQHLLANLFEEGKLIEFLHSESIVDDELMAKVQAREKGACRKGYLGHIVKIGQFLSASKSEKINEYLAKDERWQKVKTLVEKQTYEAEKNLAGYTIRKSDANNVMFHKEDILALHQAFLSKPHEPIYPEPDPQPDASDQMEITIEMLEKKLNLTEQNNTVEEPKAKSPEKTNNTSVSESVVEQVNEKEQQEGMAIYSNANYWKNSKNLNYDIGDLMNDLE